MYRGAGEGAYCFYGNKDFGGPGARMRTDVGNEFSDTLFGRDFGRLKKERSMPLLCLRGKSQRSRLIYTI